MAERYFVLIAREETGSADGVGRVLARAALGLGLQAVLVVPDASQYPHSPDDGWQYRVVAGSEPRKTLTATSRLGPGSIAGVLGDGAAAAVHAAWIATEAGLPGPDPRAIETAADFAEWQRILRERRVGATPPPAGSRLMVDITAGRIIGLSAAIVGSDGALRRLDAPGTESRRVGRVSGRRALAAARMLGLAAGPVRIELADTASGPVVCGVVPGCLDALTARVMRLSSGVDPLATAVAAAVGAQVARMRAPGRHASLCFLGSSISVSDDAGAGLRDIPGIVEVGVTAAGRARGWVVAVAEDPATAIGASEAASTLAAAAVTEAGR